MAETKHTPGPWRIEDRYILGARYVGRVDDWSGSVNGAYDKENAALKAESEANAKLIAQAPALLTSLADICCGHCFDQIGLPPSHDTDCRFCRPARDAIAAAAT
ncbi:hypothetical protein LCGC14_0532280 [marine sediment metagenome]|uniref:Uncharacterized protein n=1 Tax=marine sediment metagenome TaxID=412755 RepID=A0A0F9RZZ3_9ZZZZ